MRGVTAPQRTVFQPPIWELSNRSGVGGAPLSTVLGWVDFGGPRCRCASGALSKYGFVMDDEHGATEFGLVGEVPYYATIFTTRMTNNLDGYEEMADRMAELVSAREGFLGMQSARGDDGLGITVCYWRTEEDITAWRTDLEHENAQDEGRSRWYAQYTGEVARVDRTIEFRRPN